MSAIIKGRFLPLIIILPVLMASCDGGSSGGGSVSDAPNMEIDNDAAPPAAPTGLIAQTRSATVIELTWDTPIDSESLKEYAIIRDGIRVGAASNSTSSSSQPLSIKSVTVGLDGVIKNREHTLTAASSLARAAATNYTDSGLSSNRRYCYEVKAVDFAGNESLLSTVSCATTQAANDSAVCGTGLPLILSNFNPQQTVYRTNTGSFTTVDYQGDFTLVSNPKIMTRHTSSSGRVSTSVPVDDAPTVRSNCTMQFILSAGSDIGTITLDVKLTDFDSDLGITQNWDVNSASNVISTQIQVE